MKKPVCILILSIVLANLAACTAPTTPAAVPTGQALSTLANTATPDMTATWRPVYVQQESPQPSPTTTPNNTLEPHVVASLGKGIINGPYRSPD
ncbi:MAG TPA: hypothetical protein VHO69_18915, partial [Phototrophicaceae bacterium]|nr:hypothetical protein [Phototrophicaceae bacterium]